MRLSTNAGKSGRETNNLCQNSLLVLGSTSLTGFEIQESVLWNKSAGSKGKASDWPPNSRYCKPENCAQHRSSIPRLACGESPCAISVVGIRIILCSGTPLLGNDLSPTFLLAEQVSGAKWSTIQRLVGWSHLKVDPLMEYRTCIHLWQDIVRVHQCKR